MTTHIHPSAIVSPKATLGENVTIGPYCVVGDQVTLHNNVTLKSHVVIDGWTEIGENTIVYPFASLGQLPQARQDELSNEARLIIGKNNIIREYATMQPGTTEGGLITRVGDNGLFMASTHVAHDCQIGDHVTMANCATLGGHVIVGDHANLGGLSAVHQFVRIGHHAFIGGTARVVHDVIPYALVMGHTFHLSGLNLVGLKRSGIPREEILEMVSAYNELFADYLTLQERKSEVTQKYKNNKRVMQIINFMETDSKRSLSLPAA
jgi:UDP-N-acetylglucosamine acyltransferase